MDTYLSVSSASPSCITSSSTTGHQFLQPRVVGSALSSNSKRVGAGGPLIPAATSPSLATSSNETFTYQSVLGMDSNLTQGVTLPVQRIIEGLPVVTLPGLVANEVLLAFHCLTQLF